MSPRAALTVPDHLGALHIPALPGPDPAEPGLSQDTSQPSLSSSLGPGWCLMPGAAPVSPCSTLTLREPRAPPAPGGCWQGGEEILDMSSKQDESTEISTALQEYFLHDPKKKIDTVISRP